MGNGASSRAVTNHVQSSSQNFVARNVPNDTDFYGYHTAASYGANGTVANRYIRSYGSSTHYQETHETRNGWQQQYNSGSDNNAHGYYGVDEFIESSAAPSLNSSSRSSYRNHKNQSSHHQSPLSRHCDRHPNKTRSYQNESSTSYQGNELEMQQVPPSSEGIGFEVFHSYSGGDITVVNIDGVRYFLDSDSWTAGELQPFPEEWYQRGYIESNQRPQVASTVEMPINTVNNSNDYSLETGWNDDRMGKLDHPIRGQVKTYFEETRRNVHCVFDSNSGTWLKLPLSWEVHVPSVDAQIRVIQEATPNWDDKFEILALLRQCNYDPDEVIITYMNLLMEDTPWEGTSFRGGKSPPRLQDNSATIEALRQRIRELEDQLQQRQSELKESLTAATRLQNQLNSAQEMSRELQIKVTTLQREAQQRNNLASDMVENPPKRAKISRDIVRNVRSTVRSLSRMLAELKASLNTEMTQFAFDFDRVVASLNKLKNKANDYRDEIAELRALYHKEALQSRLLYNKTQELRGNIRVFCRCRFDSSVESALNFPSDQDIGVSLLTGQNKSFKFDRVFPPSSSQEQVFIDTLPLITSCVDGYNVCILAYGQTGAGKTYTMMGSDADPGVNIRSIRELLRVCQERKNVDYTVSVSMVEVYNETLRDLLTEGKSTKQQLNIQMTGKQLVITGVTETPVASEDDITSIMHRGDVNRSVGSTKMNTNSSRSHLLLLLTIRGTDLVTSAVTRGTLTLVDLAGSERISKTEATGQRLVEAAAINKSLSALGQVFAALRTNAMHVPYRNSKLTQLLQGSLGGDGKACLFVNVSPASSNLIETLSTLQFGSAARQVQLGKAIQNITYVPKRS